MNELLSCEALTKCYQKDKTALENVDLHIGFGRIVGLLGPNGSGKTTLIKLANGLLQPSAGSIRIAGMTPGPDTKAIVSYLPDADWLPDWMRVEQLVEMFHEFYADFDPAKANEMLARLELEPKARLKTLSKGSKEKVQLILAMSRAAKLYLLDEPIGGVDPAARDYILSTILNNYSRDATVILSTHLIGDIEPILDEAVFLKDGRVFAHRNAEELRETERGCIFPGGIQMLKQLLKYEFKATGRTYGGLYLALVALAVLSGFSLRSSSKDDFASLLLFAYMVVAVAVAVVSVMTIVTRFTRNLLGREGYLMHTLPVTESQLILSKLISSVVWMLCSSIVGIFSFAVMLLALSLNSAALQQLPELWQKVVEIFREIFRMTGSSGWLWLIFETLNGLVALVSSILCIYAACMIGHQFKKHMVPAGILAFFLLSFLQNWLSSGVSSADMLQAVSDPTLGGVDVSIAAPSAFTTLFGLAVSIAFAAGYFLLTRWLMEHKLDLE